MVVPVTIEDQLFDQLSPADLLRWARLNLQAHHAVKSYIHRNFKIQRILKRFFKNSEIPLFRYLQLRTGMIISGSAALQFLSREDFGEDTDLDVYVELRYCERVADWLHDIGYTFVQRLEGHPETFAAGMCQSIFSLLHLNTQSSMFYQSKKIQSYFGRGIANVFDFTRNGRRIQVIATEGPPIEVVLNFHSTCVMNVITHEKAYSLYPDGTFEERRSLVTRHSRIAEPVEKYIQRGWTIVHDMPSRTDREDQKGAFRESRRFVGDSQCWVLPLHPVLPLAQEGTIEANSWELSYDEKNEWKADITFDNVTSGQLKFGYTVADKEVSEFITLFFKPMNDLQKKDGYKDEDLKTLLRWKYVETATEDDDSE